MLRMAPQDDDVRVSRPNAIKINPHKTGAMR
jgi:hypothetical protein